MRYLQSASTRFTGSSSSAAQGDVGDVGDVGDATDATDTGDPGTSELASITMTFITDKRLSTSGLVGQCYEMSIW